MRLTWLCPDDRGGGVVSVAQAAAREATLSGEDATLLLLLPPVGHAAEFGGVHVESLRAIPPYADAPARFMRWLTDNPQDVVLLNGCGEVEDTPPFIPQGTRAVAVIHDTAPRYFEASVRHEASLDAIIAVSETVAARFRDRLVDPRKLFVVHNGTVFPVALDHFIHRTDDVVFLGGETAMKGAEDVIAVWPRLVAAGFSGRLQWFGTVGDAMAKRIAALPEADRIVVHGRVPRRMIFETARVSKVLLMASRVEPFGMATIEAMGMGCGVAAWDIQTGTKEIIKGPSEGAFAPLGDKDALAHAVIRVLKLTETEREAMADRVRATFSAAAMWQRLRTVLDELEERAPVNRAQAGKTPPPFIPKRRLLQLLPAPLRAVVRAAVARSPNLSHALRDFRGK